MPVVKEYRIPMPVSRSLDNHTFQGSERGRIRLCHRQRLCQRRRREEDDRLASAREGDRAVQGTIIARKLTKLKWQVTAAEYQIAQIYMTARAQAMEAEQPDGAGVEVVESKSCRHPKLGAFLTLTRTLTLSMSLTRTLTIVQAFLFPHLLHLPLRFPTSCILTPHCVCKQSTWQQPEVAGKRDEEGIRSGECLLLRRECEKARP